MAGSTEGARTLCRKVATSFDESFGLEALRVGRTRSPLGMFGTVPEGTLRRQSLSSCLDGEQGY